MKIIIKTQFEDYHRWENAPDEVAFLRNLHRHIFYVEASCKVTHDDRELEFFIVKKVLDQIIKTKIRHMAEAKSCEQMAEVIKKDLQARYKRNFTIRLFEDNENGVEV